MLRLFHSIAFTFGYILFLNCDEIKLIFTTYMKPLKNYSKEFLNMFGTYWENEDIYLENA